VHGKPLMHNNPSALRDLRDLRQHVGMFSQSFYLFPLRVMGNLANEGMTLKMIGHEMNFTRKV
jgi:ABC-type polar amino acid transport system ATPase subunit